MRRRYEAAGARTSSPGTILLRREDEVRLLPRYEAGRPGQEYGRVVKRFARRHGLDVMIVAAAVAAVVEELLRGDAPHASRSAPIIAALASLLLVLPLLARRRSPFLASTWLWLLAAALSFLDGRLVASSGSIYAVGMVSAFLAVCSSPTTRR
jgi:hypothetical protein